MVIRHCYHCYDPKRKIFWGFVDWYGWKSRDSALILCKALETNLPKNDGLWLVRYWDEALRDVVATEDVAGQKLVTILQEIHKESCSGREELEGWIRHFLEYPITTEERIADTMLWNIVDYHDIYP